MRDNISSRKVLNMWGATPWGEMGPTAVVGEGGGGGSPGFAPCGCEPKRTSALFPKGEKNGIWGRGRVSLRGEDIWDASGGGGGVDSTLRMKWTSSRGSLRFASTFPVERTADCSRGLTDARAFLAPLREGVAAGGGGPGMALPSANAATRIDDRTFAI
jgi:hypothetical protein